MIGDDMRAGIGLGLGFLLLSLASIYGRRGRSRLAGRVYVYLLFSVRHSPYPAGTK
jgi:hypothetical protein